MSALELSEAQLAAQKAKEEKEQQEYEKKLAEKRRAREALSSSGMDDPFAVPAHLLDNRFHYAIVNDRGNNLSKHLAAGYEFVEDTKISTAMGIKEKGPVKLSTNMSDPKWAYLMRIEKELYEEDQARQINCAKAAYSKLEKAPEKLNFSKKAQADGLTLDKTETLE